MTLAARVQSLFTVFGMHIYPINGIYILYIYGFYVRKRPNNIHTHATLLHTDHGTLGCQIDGGGGGGGS